MNDNNKTLDYMSNFKEIEQESVHNGFKLSYTSGTVMLPPPNVTGNLHLGHALNTFITDSKILNLMMRGDPIKWIPGTDHAGIGTQMLVKSELHKEGNASPSDQELLDAIWGWKDKYEANILGQFKNMNPSFDWSEYKFTFSEDMVPRVREAFCRLYELGLMFRDKRIVNWDISLQTVLSDIECSTKSIPGSMWYINYKLENGTMIEVGTTRPETIFADVAIAVNPNDERYAHLIGKKAQVPLVGAWVPIVGDSGVEVDKGSGAMKIDPAHGHFDFEIGQKHQLEIMQIINKHGKMCGQVPDWVLGLDRFEARKVVANKLKDEGFVAREESITQMVPCGEKSGCVLEPLILEQWFFDMAQLGQKSQAVLDEGDLKLIPNHFEGLYTHYMSKLHAWCVSRQSVWGHKIPVWYKEDGSYIVARTEEEAQELAEGAALTQDPDVLDTWFSSALWPLLTTNWGEENAKPYIYDSITEQKVAVSSDKNKVSLMGKSLMIADFYELQVFCRGDSHVIVRNLRDRSEVEIDDPADVEIIKNSILHHQHMQQISKSGIVRAILIKYVPEIMNQVKGPIICRGKVYDRFWEDKLGYIYGANSEEDAKAYVRRTRGKEIIHYMGGIESDIVKKAMIECFHAPADKIYDGASFKELTRIIPNMEDCMFHVGRSIFGDRSYVDGLNNLRIARDPEDIILSQSCFLAKDGYFGLWYDTQSQKAFSKNGGQFEPLDLSVKEIANPKAYRIGDSVYLARDLNTARRLYGKVCLNNEARFSYRNAPDNLKDLVQEMASIPEPREDYLIRRADSDDEIFWSGMNSKARFGSMYIKVGYADHTVLEIRFKLGYAEILNVKTGYIVKSLKMGEFVRNCILRGAGYSKIENKSRLLELIYNEMHSLKPENNKYALLCGKIWNNFWLDWKDNIFGADNESEARLRSGAIYADSSKISFKMTINKEFVFENKYFSFSNPKMVATFKNAPTEDLFGMLDVARQSGMELKSLDFLPDNAQYIASKKFDHDTQSIWIKNDELILEISSKIRDPKVVGLVKDILTNKQDVEELKEVLQCKSLRLENNVRKIEDIKAFLKEKNHRIAEKMASITGISNITVSNLVVPYSGLDKSSYPNRFLVTGSDILFFWVSKMIQANLALGEMPSPFKEVYLHGLVQDECGKKMSKSKGNVINPLELFDEQGVDVVRFSMLNAATAGRNVRFGSANIDKSRKFLIKIWNGMSCCINNIDNPKLTQDRFNMQEILKSPANKWILSLIYQLDHKINNKFDKWDVYGATEAVYSFFWDRFCSEYIEVSKYLLKTEAKDETRFVMQVACAKLMQILLPFVPAISQHFWNKLADFQIYDRIACYFHEDLEFEKTLQIGRNIRSLAKNFQLSNEVQITIDKECDTNLLSAFTRLKVVFGAPNTAIFAMDGVQISFGEIDGLQDKKSKILQSIEEEIALLRSKLNDDGFVKNADAQEVANYKSRLEELEKDKKVYE